MYTQRTHNRHASASKLFVHQAKANIISTSATKGMRKWQGTETLLAGPFKEISPKNVVSVRTQAIGKWNRFSKCLSLFQPGCLGLRQKGRAIMVKFRQFFRAEHLCFCKARVFLDVWQCIDYSL